MDDHEKTNGAEMSEPVKASPEFVANFQAVCRYYRCPADEIEIMKQLARNDMPAAVESFGAMVREIADGKI